MFALTEWPCETAITEELQNSLMSSVPYNHGFPCVGPTTEAHIYPTVPSLLHIPTSSYVMARTRVIPQNSGHPTNTILPSLRWTLETDSRRKRAKQ